MNKKLNTILFLLGATLFNVLIAVLSFVLLTLLFVNIIMPVIPEQYHVWGFTFIFVASLVISFLAYRYALKYLLKRINIEKYFDPIFGKNFRR
jgi:hypothetical protein